MNKPFISYESNIHYHIGIAYANLNKFKKAEPALSTAIELNQTEPRYFHERAKALLLTKRFEESLDDFNVVVEMQPNNPHAYFGRAFAHKALKQFTEAA